MEQVLLPRHYVIDCWEKNNRPKIQGQFFIYSFNSMELSLKVTRLIRYDQQTIKMPRAKSKKKKSEETSLLPLQLLSGDIRGRPLMIWGGEELFDRKFFSPELLARKFFFPREGQQEIFFLDFLRPAPRIINGRPLNAQI